MSLTSSTYTERTWYVVSGGLPEAQAQVYRPAIEATQGDAIQQLCVASLTEPWRDALESDFALALTSGVASFSAAPTLLPDSIVHCDKITHPSVTGPGTRLLPFRIVETPVEMALQAVPDAVFACAYVGAYAVEALYQGAILTGTLTVRGVAIPAITAVPVPLEARLIEIGAQLAIAKVRGINQPSAA